MQLKRLFVAIFLLAGLGAGIWWSNRNEKNKESQPDPKAPPKILSLSWSKIAKIEIARQGGETTVLEIPKDNEYKLTAPEVHPVDREAALSLVKAAAETASDKVVEEKAANPAEFGLDNPAITVTLTLRDGKTRKISIGDEVPVGGGSFASVDGDPRVFLLGSFGKGNLDKKAADLRDKRLLRFAPETLARLTLAGKGPAIELFKKGESEWQITAPKPLRANNWEIEELVRKLGEAKIDPALSADQVKDLEKAFAAAPPLSKVTVSGGDGTQSLEVRKNKEGKFYAKSSAVEGAHLLGDELGKSLEKGLDDYRNKKLFDFAFSEPTRIEYKDAKTALIAARSQDKWLRDGKPLDNVGVQSLIDKLRDLSATGWPEGALGSPEITVTVVSNDGKRSEKISLAPAGAKWRAQRDAEPGLYELDPAPVDELRSTAAAVREPAPPKPPAKK